MASSVVLVTVAAAVLAQPPRARPSTARPAPPSCSALETQPARTESAAQRAARTATHGDAPPTTYRCDGGSCAAAPPGTGVDLETCQRLCLKDGVACQDKQCVPQAGGVNKNNI